MNVRYALRGSAGSLGKTDNCRLRCCPLTCRPAHPQLRGLKLVGTATAVTTGSRGLEARVRTEPHVRSGKPAKCLLSRKTAEQEQGGKKKIIHVGFFFFSLNQTYHVCLGHL